MASGLQPLPLLHVDRFPGAARGDQQVGLAAEKRRDLEGIGHLGHGGGLLRLVDVGKHRQAARGPGPLERAQSFLHAGPTTRPEPGAVGLIEAGLETDRDAEIALEAGQRLGHPWAARRRARSHRARR